MKRAGRTVVVIALVAVGAAAATLGVAGAPDRTQASPYLTAQVTRGTVQKAVSDSGQVVDPSTYAIVPDGDPVLTQNAGTTAGQVGAARESYQLSAMRVAPGDTVAEDDVIAVVTDSDDKKKNVKAPFAGRIRTVSTAKNTDLTQVATMGVGRPEIVVDVSEYDVTRLKVDQNATLQLAAGNRSFDGKVAAIGQAARTSSGVQTYQVVLSTRELPASTRVGMTVNATITVTSRSGVLTVPLTAVSETDGQSQVQVVGADGVATAQPVTVGLVGDTSVEITRGLRAGQEVVTGTAAATTASAAAAPNGPPGGNAGGAAGGGS